MFLLQLITYITEYEKVACNRYNYAKTIFHFKEKRYVIVPLWLFVPVMLLNLARLAASSVLERIATLLDNNIFVTDNKYSNYGAKSLGYKFSEQYDEKIAAPIKIRKYTLIKSIVYNSSPKIETYLPETSLEEVAYLTKWFNRYLQIDMRGVEALSRIIFRISSLFGQFVFGLFFSKSQWSGLIDIPRL